MERHFPLFSCGFGMDGLLSSFPLLLNINIQLFILVSTKCSGILRTNKEKIVNVKNSLVVTATNWHKYAQREKIPFGRSNAGFALLLLPSSLLWLFYLFSPRKMASIVLCCSASFH
jgi:hypothetical protein